jgi:hypothetical protein
LLHRSNRDPETPPGITFRTAEETTEVSFNLGQEKTSLSVLPAKRNTFFDNSHEPFRNMTLQSTLFAAQ